jgi:hypothetical protein
LPDLIPKLRLTIILTLLTVMTTLTMPAVMVVNENMTFP